MKIKIDEVLSDGYVIGKAKIIKFSKKKTIVKDQKEELEKFNIGKEEAIKVLNQMREKEPTFDEYLFAHELMVKDPVLDKMVKELIINENLSAEEAVKKTMNEITSNLLNSDSNYLKERATDILDVTNLLVNSMTKKRTTKAGEKFIAVVDDLLPSFLVNNRQNILGVIAKKGGFTSHASIIARIWDIPFVIAKSEIKNGDLIVIDTGRDAIILNPSEEELQKYNKEITDAEPFEKMTLKHAGFNFMANVATNRDIKKAMEYKFDGIGLFRTELIFLNTNRPYTLLEHYEMYSTAVAAAGGKPVIFRTFDAKEDKVIPYLKIGKSSLDTYLKNKDIFENQIKALLAANKTNKVKIMFPMIETKDEFNYLKNWVIKIQQENNYNLPRIGMMLETKKALKNINTFEGVDFISIGTNDLTKELYNIDRNNHTEYHNYIDDLLEQIKKVVRFAEDNEIYLSVCGELASVKGAALYFYEIGIRNLSVSPSSIKALNMAYHEFMNRKRKFYIVGDSTLSSFNDVSYLYPRYGYGTQLQKYFNDKIEVVNLALSGRSAKSYLKEDNYKRLFDEIKPNDFLLIAFGHNDQKEDDPYRFSTAAGGIGEDGSFANILNENYIKKAKEIGAKVIIASPISRLSPDEKYKGVIVHNTANGNYKDAALFTAKYTHCLGVDLTTPTKKLYQKLTYAKALYHHAIIKPKNEKMAPDIASVDNTHLNYYGADYVAYLFALAIKKSNSELKNYLIDDIKEPTVDELEINPNCKFTKYEVPNLKNYYPKKNMYNDLTYFGTRFGNIGAKESYDDFIATYDDKFIVGTKEPMGKLNGGSTTIAGIFAQIPLTKNARAIATIKVLSTKNVKQAGFGLMIRDDAYLNQEDKTLITNSNYIASGLVTADTTTNAIFYRENYTDLKIEKNVFNHLYDKDDIIYAEITRIGQRISVKTIYENKICEKDFYDFDLKVVDGKYYYLGLFSTNGTLIESEDFKVELLNNAVEA